MKQNIDIKASLKDNNIIVSYEDSTATMEYELIYNDSNLEMKYNILMENVL